MGRAVSKALFETSNKSDPAIIFTHMNYSLAPHEEATVNAFIVKERRERFLELLANPKHRHKITESLAHPNPAWFDARCVKAIPSAQRGAASIAKLLRSKGAGTMCWVVSEDHRFDAHEVELDSVLTALVGHGMGAIVSCVAGKLAFVESETSRFILEK
ncbi:MAG TPA: hypothetical protein VGG15_05700 [Terriglobales bacterium]|jgi:hypothetical protein